MLLTEDTDYTIKVLTSCLFYEVVCTSIQKLFVHHKSMDGRNNVRRRCTIMFQHMNA